MTTRALTLCASICLAASTVWAADPSFAGKWKLDPKKSKFTGLQEKIENLGGDKYKFAFGDDVETITLDGKEHPTKYGNMWSVTKAGENSWKSVHKRGGKVTSTATWTLSNDGKMFTSATDGTRPDGSTYHNVFKAKRIAGGPGLAGTWESIEIKMNSPAAIEIQPWEKDGWSIITPSQKEQVNLKFDGKDYADKGPRVAKGTTISGKRIDNRTVELTTKLNGKTQYTEHMQLSADGKTITSTLHFAGVAKPEIDVYGRQ